MRLIDIVERTPTPEPWREGDAIPWNEPGFSARMLKEHLTQAHDHASRRMEKIDRHVAWIHQRVLASRPTRILDLGCGPGLYAVRLAAPGHTLTGIDFSPASIACAREQAATIAAEAGARCAFTCEDIRTAEYGGDYGLVMLIFGEFNVFKPGDARKILAKARAALAPGGLLLLETSTYTAIGQMGRQPSSWYSARAGLFSDAPHILCEESFWDETTQAATTRYFVLDAATADVTRHAASYQAYTDDALVALLNECGFDDVVFHPSLLGAPDEAQPDMQAVVAKARHTSTAPTGSV